MVFKKEKKLKNLKKLPYDYDNNRALAYDIEKYFSKLSIRGSNVISYYSEYYEEKIKKNNNEYFDEKLIEDELFRSTHLMVSKILYLYSSFFRLMNMKQKLLNQKQNIIN